MSKPESLVCKADEWTRSLLEAINNDQPIPDGLIEKYRQKDVREALRRMYSDDDGCYCCYCEAQIDEVAYDHIEHRKPKDTFPECVFDWDNLHLSCPKCNNHKRKKWDDVNPILDAVVDPIKEHLGYKEATKGLYRLTLSKRGITTVEHADLDRSGLLRGRRKVYFAIKEAVDRIKLMGEDPKVYTEIKILRDTCSGEFGSMIEWILDERLPVDGFVEN